MVGRVCPVQGASEYPGLPGGGGGQDGRVVAEGNSINGEFMSRLVEFISGPYLAAALATTVVTAILGTVLARAVFKKHLVKAGLLKETK